jgi:hypothetical protein
MAWQVGFASMSFGAKQIWSEGGRKASRKIPRIKTQLPKEISNPKSQIEDH